MRNPTIDCQACGDILRRLTLAEAQKVAENPYNYISFCTQCQKDDAHIEPEFK